MEEEFNNSFGKGLALYSQQKLDEGWNAAIDRALQIIAEHWHVPQMLDYSCLSNIEQALNKEKR